MKLKLIFFALSATILSITTGSIATAQTTATPDHGIALTNMNTSVHPGDNFFLYTNGSYITRTTLPADRASLSVFSALADTSDHNVATIIDDATKSNAPAGSNEAKIAALYRSYMDEPAIESSGMKSLQPHLAEIAAISNPHQLAHALGASLRSDVDALNNTNFHTANIFGLWVAPSFNDPDHYAPYLMQGGILLPNRDYYLSDSAGMKNIRTQYLLHIAAMLRIVGISEPDTRANRILKLETAIAEKQISLADSENIHKANNPWKLADFPAKAPGLDWPEYFRAASLDRQSTFIVWQPSAITGEAALVASQSIDSWKDLLGYHLIEAYATATSKALADERFNFIGKVLSGTTQQRPRETRGDIFVSSVLGEAVGKLYAQRFFSPEAKAQAQALVKNLLAAFRIRLQNLSWMAPATRKEALTKLGTLKVGIGYPDTWRSYAALEIKPGDLFGNIWRSSLFEYSYDLNRIGKPVDRGEWCMDPQTVNAVNLPLDNGLNFPAAILQPPFFDPKAPDAANYGAIGTIIGHEISHTFDSEGAAFDSQGRVRNWWTPDDLAHFEAATAALAAQYDTYKPFPDLAVNGKQTLGENIADVAGLAAAFDGFHATLHGTEAYKVNNLTGDQQFFIAFGQNWGSITREATLRRQVLTDPHAPAEFRADTVRNNDGWYAAFDIKPTDKLYLTPEERVRIW